MKGAEEMKGAKDFAQYSVVTVAISLVRYNELFPLLQDLAKEDEAAELPDSLQEESRQILLSLVAFARSMNEVKEEFAALPDSPLALLPLINELIYNYSLLALPRSKEETFLPLLLAPSAIESRISDEAISCLKKYGQEEAVKILQDFVDDAIEETK